jgi:heparin/heparan-sulfate lyase
MLAFEDRGDYLYLAADATRAYSTNKLKCFTRQIVFLRPGTFVLFDRVTSTKPEFKKTWLLQAMKTPERHGEDWVVTNGAGRLFVQTVLPVSFRTSVAKAEELYRYDGQVFAPRRDTGPAPECRLETSPAQSNATDLFLHVLTATDARVDAVPRAAVVMQGNRLQVTVADVKLLFRTDSVGGDITRKGLTARLTERVVSNDPLTNRN